MKTMMTIILLLGMALTATPVQAGEPCDTSVGCFKLPVYIDESECAATMANTQLGYLDPSDPLASATNPSVEFQKCF